MAQDNSTKLEQPTPLQKSQPLSGMDVRVFTMPEQYRFGAQTALHQPEAMVVSKTPVQREPVAGAIQKPVEKPPAAKQPRSARRLILFIGMIVIFLLGIGGFFLVQNAKKQAPVPVVVPAPVVRPAPEVKQPEETKEPVVTEPVKEPEVFPVEIAPGTDSDSDGLSDIEETLIYKTDPRLPDTDADGFLDGNEVFHRYNPAGTAPGTLFESGVVKSYKNTDESFSYGFYYPSSWSYQDTETGLLLDAKTGEGFRISLMEKGQDLSLTDWLTTEFPDEMFANVTTKNKLVMAQSKDQRTVYFDLGVSVLAFVYDTGIKTRVDYLQTFQMILNSVQISSVKSPDLAI